MTAKLNLRSMRFARLDEICESTPRHDPRADGDGEFLYVDIEAIDNRRNRIIAPKQLVNSAAPSRARHEIRAGDVLVSLVRPYLRNIARVPAELDGQIASSAFCVLRPSQQVTTNFLFYAVLRDSFIQSIVTYGESPPAARDREFLALAIPLPPIADQERITEFLDLQWTRLDEAITSLETGLMRANSLREAILRAGIEDGGFSVEFDRA